MAKVKEVNIMKRVKVAGGWRFCPIVYGGGGKIKPDAVLVKGVEEIHPEGLYYLDFLQDGKRIRISANSATEALTAAEKQNKLLMAHDAATKAGVALPEPELNGGRSIREAVTAYLLEVKAHKKPKTHTAYELTLRYFLESCRQTALEQITRIDLLAFKTFLRVKKDQSDRSVANKFENLMTFLKAADVRIKLSKHDWPVYTQEEVSTYTDEELDKFSEACDETEKLWFKFFYLTAMREQEVIHAEWSWIDFENKTATVRENKRFGFNPKAYKGRSIPLTSELVALLKAWKAKSNDTTCGLIFPTSGCNPKLDFLDVCKAIAKRAGLSDFYLHKFRATRATHLLQDGMDIKSVQRILGHSDLESTMRYLGAQRTEVLQAQVEQMASRF